MPSVGTWLAPNPAKWEAFASSKPLVCQCLAEKLTRSPKLLSLRLQDKKETKVVSKDLPRQLQGWKDFRPPSLQQHQDCRLVRVGRCVLMLVGGAPGCPSCGTSGT